MDFSAILADMEAGVTLGVGATLIFLIIVALMSMKKDEGEDEVTTLYNRYNSEVEQNRHDDALSTALEHLPALFKKTKNVNDLGEGFTMVAVTAERLEKNDLAFLCSNLAARYLTESGVASYPLYKKCRERALEIGETSKTKLSSDKQGGLESQADTLWGNGMKSLVQVLKTLAA